MNYLQIYEHNGSTTNLSCAASITYTPPRRWNTYQKFASKGEKIKYKRLFGKIKEREECYTEDVYISDWSELLGEYENVMTKEELLENHVINKSSIIFDEEGYICDAHIVCITDLAGEKHVQYFQNKSDAMNCMEELSNILLIPIKSN